MIDSSTKIKSNCRGEKTTTWFMKNSVCVFSLPLAPNQFSLMNEFSVIKWAKPTVTKLKQQQPNINEFHRSQFRRNSSIVIRLFVNVLVRSYIAKCLCAIKSSYYKSEQNQQLFCLLWFYLEVFSFCRKFYWIKINEKERHKSIWWVFDMHEISV